MHVARCIEDGVEKRALDEKAECVPERKRMKYAVDRYLWYAGADVEGLSGEDVSAMSGGIDMMHYANHINGRILARRTMLLDDMEFVLGTVEAQKRTKGINVTPEVFSD